MLDAAAFYSLSLTLIDTSAAMLPKGRLMRCFLAIIHVFSGFR